MVNSQSISDPLLDTGPAVPADLASYIGYMPVPTITPLGVNSYGLNPYGVNPYGYGYGSQYPNYPGFAAYPSLLGMTYPAARRASYLYAPRVGYTSIYSVRPGYPAGMGVGSSPRPTVFVPRPTAAPRVGVTVHPVGRR
jgi:hypothetical protein